MDKTELYNLLEIEDGSEFEYFEDFAALIECEASIESDVIYSLLKEVSLETFSELCASYFEEILEAVPNDSIEVYTLLENVQRSIRGLALHGDGESSLLQLADEVNRFRIWYCIESKVICRNFASDLEEEMPVSEALVTSRLEKISGDKYSFDFTNSLDYPMEEYIMSFADIMKAEDDESQQNDDDDDEDDDGTDDYEK